MYFNRFLIQLAGLTGVIILIYIIIYFSDDYEAQYSLLKLPKDLINYPVNSNLSETSLIYKERHKASKLKIPKKCLPISLGILPEQDTDYFISKKVECYNKFNPKYFKIEDDLLQITCYGEAEYFIDDKTSERMIGEYPAVSKWKKYNSPVKIKGSEFAFAKCNNQHYSLLKNQFDYSKFKQSLDTSAEIHNKTGTRPKKIIFIYLLIDSLSRQNFFRNLNQTATFLLSNLSYSGHLLYDFFMNNIENFDTVSNFAPMFLGMKLEALKKTLNASVKEEKDREKFLKYQNQSALWSEFKRKGFVTLFSTESSKDFISSITGREILTDHIIGGFWREASRSLKFTEFTTSAQCIAGKMPHEYSLNYLKDFLSNYKDTNRAVFLHINTAHEETCSRVKQLDVPLLRFLKWLMKDDTEKLLIIAGDHGRYLNPVNLESNSERSSPAHFVAASASLMERLDLHQTFQANQDKLLSRLDWYETVKSVSLFPYVEGRKELESEDQKEGFNLFYQNVSKYRDCSHIRVPRETCICHNQVIRNLEKKGFFDLVSMSIMMINSYFSEKEKEIQCEVIRKYEISTVIQYGPFNDLKETIKILVFFESDSKNASLVISLLNRYAMTAQKLNKNLGLTSSSEIIRRINGKLKGDHRLYSIRSSFPEDLLIADKDLRKICIRIQQFN